MSDDYLPVVEESTIDIAAYLCGNYTELTGDNHTCVVWDYLFRCMAQPSDWKYFAGGVYMPYAWVEESVVYDSDTADGIKMINSIREIGDGVQQWCLVAAGSVSLQWVHSNAYYDSRTFLLTTDRLIVRGAGRSAVREEAPRRRGGPG